MAKKSTRKKQAKTTLQRPLLAASVDKVRNAHRMIIKHDCVDIARRNKLESDPPKWLMTFLPESFPHDFGKVHLSIIEMGLEAIVEGGRFAVAAPRGTGKSTLVNGLCVYALITGMVQFPVLCPWKSSDVKKALKFWKTALCYNQILANQEYGYYNECAPFAASGGNSQKLKYLWWEDTGNVTGAQLILSDGMLVMPDSKGVIGAVTLNGNPRGLYHVQDDGDVLRPDMVMIDDPSDRETARSPEQTRRNCEVIDSDVMGMAGPTKRMPALMTCTIIETGDTASHYLGDDTPSWAAITAAQIERWPDNLEIWETWNKLRLKTQHSKNKKKKREPIVFYKKHKKQMIAGMQVSWSERYDRDRGDPDAYYSAMLDFFVMGAVSFASERQNAPMLAQSSVYDLSVGDIIKKAEPKRGRGNLPADAVNIVTFTDINHYGLHWVTIGFANDFSGWVVDYGVFNRGGEDIVPKNSTEQDRNKLIYEALCEHGEELAAMRINRDGQSVKNDLWLIDGGYVHPVVQRYIDSNRLPFQTLVSRGYSGDRYRPTGKKIIGSIKEQCHMSAGTNGRFIAMNADFWREVAQRAWLGSIGAPGGLNLWGRNEADHRELAEHICREKLSEVIEGKSGRIWVWRQQPGRHDYGDCVYGCYVGAAWLGLLTTGAIARKKKTLPRRKAR